ncbi:MAG: prepilin-type N-terminal cleavage/methylation domain-containing protein [Candidatus Electrothrix sp. AR1]|nr:prepilin-type N-terminal cleavage/methylation domain-containing protein [Candidatus Electrothrix sp. AR1]
MVFIFSIGNANCNNKNEEAACCKEKFDNWTIWRDVMIKKKKTSNSAGFTFAELMVVIAVIGVLSAVGIPSFLRGMPERRLKNAARNLYADLQKARLLAVKENRLVVVWFNSNDDTYHFEDDEPPPATDPGFGVWDRSANDNEFGKELVDYGAVTYGCSDTSLPGATINIGFDSLGTAKDQSGTALTADSVPIYLQSQNDATVCYAVTVSSLGVVKILRYSDSVWNK